MLKKMAALLLAGVMALALFTACGEDSTPSFGKQVEDAAIKAVNTALGENSTLTNDTYSCVATGCSDAGKGQC